MPELLEHVRLWVDPLKDAVGSPFDKADRLHLYGILARYPVILVECLGGLFFDGRHSCTEDSFVGRSGLYRNESLVVSTLVTNKVVPGQFISSECCCTSS